MDELSKANKLVLRYFVRTTTEKPENQWVIESMLLIVQMGGHAAGYGEGY